MNRAAYQKTVRQSPPENRFRLWTHQRVDCALQELNVEGTVFYHLDHLAEQILWLDDIAEVAQCLFDNGGLILFVCPRLFIIDTVILEKICHILLCPVRKVVVEDHTQDVVLELIRLHVSAQGICHCP